MVDKLKERGVEILWGRKVVGVGGQEEDSNEAWVDVEAEGDETNEKRRERLEADFVVGCDGGNSGVRKCLFPGRANFPGFTWEEQIVATNVGS